LVVSSLVKKEDTMLFKEMGVDLSLDKPTGSAALTTAVMSLIQQKIVPGSYKALETKIRKALKGKDVKLAQELMVQIEAMPDVPQSCIKSLQAEFFFFEGKAHEAQTLCYQAMMEGGDSLINLNLLGKIMLKLGAFEESIKLFNKAQQFNPLNFERLCLLAEAQNEVGNKESAKEHIEQAETMDANNQRIISTKANMAMANKDDAEASDLLTQLDSLGDILSFSNNRAISLAKSGELTKSRELYERVLRNLPANKHDIKSTLYYNIALNYIRSGDLKKADEYISRALLNGHKESVKLMDLQRKIQKSIKSGHKLSFQNKPPGKVELSTMVLDLNPGDLCCYRIFSQPANLDEKVSALINKPLKFKFVEKKTNP
jgi:tetratricopeptide (TPR) repeat protein